MFSQIFHELFKLLLVKNICIRMQVGVGCRLNIVYSIVNLEFRIFE